MNKLQKYFRVFLAGLFLNTLIGSATVSATSDTEIPPIAATPKDSCSLGFSCQSTASCRGGSVIGLCSSKLSNGYTIRLRGKIPDSINLFSTKYHGIPADQTRLVLRINDDNKKPLIDLVITKETIGLGLVGVVDRFNFNHKERISKGINIDRAMSNFRVEAGDNFDYYLFYRNNFFTFLFKHKDGKYYEVGSIPIQNKTISSIYPLTGPMDHDILFEQTKSLSIPSTYVQHFTPNNPSPQTYSGPFVLRIGSELVYPGGGVFEDGVKIIMNQGEVVSNKVVHTFYKVGETKVQLKISIKYNGNYKYKFIIENIFKRENKEVNFDASSLKDLHLYYNSDIIHLGYLFTDGHVLVCIGDTCFASTEVKGSEIGKINSNVWFSASTMLSFPEQTLMGSAIGKYKCRIGEVTCSGSEFRLQNPLSPGQKIEIQSLYSESGNYFNEFVPVSQKGIFGAIAMGDSDNMRAAVFLSKNSVSLVTFSENGVASDNCSVYLSGNNAFNIKNEIKIIVGLSSNNKLGVSGYIGSKIMLFCEVNAGSTSISKIRPVQNSYHSASSKFTLSNDYPANGYEGISGGSSVSRSQQQAANCYLATNGECNASKVVHMDGAGFIKSVYLTVKSSSVTFPFTFYVKSSDNNSDQFAFTIIATGKFSMRNVNTQDIIYTKIPPSCMERILLEGLSMLLSSDQSRLFASVCGFVLGNVPSTSLNKKLTFIFHNNMKGNSVQVSTFPVFGGGNVALNFVKEKYSAYSENIVKDDDLLFSNPCDARKSVSTKLENCSALINMSPNALTNGYSIIITGRVEKPSSHLEQAFNIGIPIESAIQVFNLRAENGRTIYQFFITQDQLGLSVHDPNDIALFYHVGAPIPANVNLEEGSYYRIGIGFKDSTINLLIENPFGSGKFAMLRRSLVSQISGWGETMYNVDFSKFTAINSIYPELLVKSPYTYSLSNNLNSWFPVSKEFYAPKSGDNSCTLPVYGICTTTKVYMPGNKPVNNDAKFFMRFYSFQRNTFSLYFKREDGTVVLQIDFTSSSTLWNGSVKIKFKTRFEESTDYYFVNLASGEFILHFTGNAVGYFLDGQWRVFLSLEEKDNFNQVTASQLDGFVIEYVRASNTNSSPWQYIKYGSNTAKASMVLGYDKCNAQNPSHGWFSRAGAYYPASSIENLCSKSLHPNKFSLTFKSRYQNYVKDEVAKTFPNFPGFLGSIVLLYNGSVVYTLVVARKYISFFNSLYSGEAGKFSSCSSQVPDESEFQPGSRYYITFYIDGSELHVYFHSYKEGKSALLCKLPYVNHFNAAKTFGQVFISSSDTVAGINYNLIRTLYNPTLNSNYLYPMGYVVTKNAILSSGMPFSPNESLSVEMSCGKELIFSGQTGKPQLRLKMKDSNFTLENIPGKVTATGKLSDSCVCSTPSKKIIVNLAYIRNQFRLIACKVSAASIFTTGASIYQVSSEEEIKVTYRTDLRLAVASSLTYSQISKVEEQPDTSKDEESTANDNRFIPESFTVQATMHVVPKYITASN